MIKPDKTVMKETGFMAAFSLIASVLMQAVFLIIGKLCGEHTQFLTYGTERSAFV